MYRHRHVHSLFIFLPIWASLLPFLILAAPVHAADLPAAPQNLQAIAKSDGIYLSWDAVDTARTYTIYRGTSKGGESVYKSGIIGTTFANIANLDNQTVYYYQVAAVNGTGEGPRSSETVMALNPALLVTPTPATTTPPGFFGATATSRYILIGAIVLLGISVIGAIVIGLSALRRRQQVAIASVPPTMPRMRSQTQPLGSGKHPASPFPPDQSISHMDIFESDLGADNDPLAASRPRAWADLPPEQRSVGRSGLFNDEPFDYRLPPPSNMPPITSSPQDPRTGFSPWQYPGVDPETGERRIFRYPDDPPAHP